MISFIKIIIVFVFILILLRRRVSMGVTMLAASIALGLLFQLGAEAMVTATGRGIFSLTSLDLVGSLTLILFLENLMRRTQLLQRMVNSVTGLAKDQRIAMALLPAFIGLLPSVGGAIFSAPMVEQASQGVVITPERKSFINYWYRHLWEYFLPIYPSVILASQILNLPIATIIAAQVPLSLAAMLFGIPVAFRRLERRLPESGSEVGRRTHLLNLGFGLAPIIAVMILVIGFRVNVSISLLVVFVGILLIHRFTVRQAWDLVRKAFSRDVALLAFSILIFKEVISASGAIEALPEFFSSVGIPVAAVVFALPFIVGLISGINQAPVAITFPIVAALTPTAGADARLIAFAFASGFAGVMLSPAHMCLVLTVRHFKADFGRTLSMVAPPQVAVLVVGVSLYLFR